MSKIDYQALREAAERAIPAMEHLLTLPADDDLLSEQELKDSDVDINAINNFKLLTGPETVLALLDEREAQSKRTAELETNIAALAAENTRLKAGPSYFSYGSEHNFEWHKTAEEAIEAAEAAIDDYRGDACDRWSEDVDSVCWGIIMQSSTKVGERPRNEDDCCDPAIDTICDYALLPDIETPATDAFLDEVRVEARSEGINYAASRLAAAFNHGFINKPLREVFDVTRMILSVKKGLANELYPIDGLSGEYAEKSLEEWAEQLRKGDEQ